MVVLSTGTDGGNSLEADLPEDGKQDSSVWSGKVACGEETDMDGSISVRNLLCGIVVAVSKEKRSGLAAAIVRDRTPSFDATIFDAGNENFGQRIVSGVGDEYKGAVQGAEPDRAWFKQTFRQVQPVGTVLLVKLEQPGKRTAPVTVAKQS